MAFTGTLGTVDSQLANIVLGADSLAVNLLPEGELCGVLQKLDPVGVPKADPIPVAVIFPERYTAAVTMHQCDPAGVKQP